MSYLTCYEVIFYLVYSTGRLQKLYGTGDVCYGIRWRRNLKLMRHNVRHPRTEFERHNVRHQRTEFEKRSKLQTDTLPWASYFHFVKIAFNTKVLSSSLGLRGPVSAQCFGSAVQPQYLSQHGSGVLWPRLDFLSRLDFLFGKGFVLYQTQHSGFQSYIFLEISYFAFLSARFLPAVGVLCCTAVI